MNYRLLAGVLLAGFSGLSTAANEVNIGMSSEYVFRGVTQSNGAQVWGSFDYALDNTGLYTGLWLSNSGLAGNEEVDVYAGYALALSDDLSLDFGGIGYFDPSAPASSTVNNSSEAYLGVNWQALNVYAYYNFGGTAQNDDESIYGEANFGLPVLADAKLQIHLGYFAGTGDFYDSFADDSYFDYGLSFIKDYGDAGQIALAVTATTIDENHGLVGVFAESDRPQFTVGWSRGFGAAF
ncbi:MAG: TorF family putative porin [Oceanococcus sp.]